MKPLPDWPHKAVTRADWIRAVSVARGGRVRYGRYAFDGVLFEDGNIVATDSLRLFVAHPTKSTMNNGFYYINPQDKARPIGPRHGGMFPDWRSIIVLADVGEPLRITDLKVAFRRARQANIMTNAEWPNVVIVRNPDDTLGFMAGIEGVGFAEINIHDDTQILGAVRSSHLIDALRFHAMTGQNSLEMKWAGVDRIMYMETPSKSTITVLASADKPWLPEEFAKKIREKKFAGKVE